MSRASLVWLAQVLAAFALFAVTVIVTIAALYAVAGSF